MGGRGSLTEHKARGPFKGTSTLPPPPAGGPPSPCVSCCGFLHGILSMNFVSKAERDRMD